MSKRYVIKKPAGARLPDRLARFREELNEEQFAVATAPAGAALVIAGAGSGKTRAITYRVAYLVEHGVAPARVMLATFTNRAAREMLRRVEQLTGGGGDVARLENREVGLWLGIFVEPERVLHPDESAALKPQCDELRQDGDAGRVTFSDRRHLDNLPADKLQTFVLREDADLAHPLIVRDGETMSGYLNWRGFLNRHGFISRA